MAVLLKSGNMQLNYEVLGLSNSESKPLILLFHGAGGDLHHYDNVTHKLVKKGYRVLLMDIRHHGLSQPISKAEPVTFDFDDVLKDVDQVLTHVVQQHYTSKKTHSLYVGGLSMGGMIALMFGEEKAKVNYKWNKMELKGLVLMASAVPGMQIERSGWDAFRDRTATLDYLQWSKQAIIQSSITKRGQTETARALGLISDKALYECMVNIALQLPNPTDPPVAYKPRVCLPMLLLMPEQDPLTRPEMELLHKINRQNNIPSRFVLVPNSGHMVILDQSEAVYKQIHKFCS
ncbi:hypothetical protein A0J61_01138 [Choanephora cucurbitarum]|uniref:Serine aminopeptidase S33 domain-containing protein n=1 Tax=Choanephora cucurbitarum TaxID=101091 RepID=A0A1C7NQU8_9FUNG|nr:hypothetical protein A0J61_01138 [Choanephora cucurbitarum]